MPSKEGMSVKPGRSSEIERKREEGPVEAGVIPNRFEGNAAPSGLLPVTGGISCAIMEFRGRARPRTPSNDSDRGSAWTTSAAAGKCEILSY